jgi:magnesium-transporting ATPase (P-type)
MTLLRLWTAGREWDPLDVQDAATEPVTRTLTMAALASRQQAHDGGGNPQADPVDAAILQAAARVALDDNAVPDIRPPAAIVPFSSDRKFMAVLHSVQGCLTAFAKGAPRRMSDRCSRVLTSADEAALDHAGREALMAVNDDLASRGLRVLAVASGPVRAPPSPIFTA